MVAGDNIMYLSKTCFPIGLHGMKHSAIILQCISGRGVYKMVKRLFEDPPYVMVTGPVLSSIATAVAEVSYNWNVTQVLS